MGIPSWLCMFVKCRMTPKLEIFSEVGIERRETRNIHKTTIKAQKGKTILRNHLNTSRFTKVLLLTH